MCESLKEGTITSAGSSWDYLDNSLWVPKGFRFVLPMRRTADSIAGFSGSYSGTLGYSTPSSPAANFRDNSLAASSNPSLKVSDEDFRLENQSTQLVSAAITHENAASLDNSNGRRQGLPPAVESGQKEITGVGAGLLNLGNSCFINSVLQCITHTVPLILYFRQYEDPASRKCDIEEFCVVCSLRDHIGEALNHSGGVISPRAFFDNLNYISCYLEKYQQEDAFEFLQCFLEKIERTCLDSSAGEAHKIQGPGIVEQIFGGCLISRLSCRSCGGCSYSSEFSTALSLEIEDVEDLVSALQSFTRVEELQDELGCDYCQRSVVKYKQLFLGELPQVLTLNLKRFKNDGNTIYKIDKHVEFPLELDVEPYMRRESGKVDSAYYLYAIVEHRGCISYGHYFSFVRSAPNTWHKFNDSEVHRVLEEDILTRQAYILFYVRADTPWFSSIFQPEPSLKTSPKSVLAAKLEYIADGQGFGKVEEEAKKVVEVPMGSSKRRYKEGINTSEHEESFSVLGQMEVDVAVSSTIDTLETAHLFHRGPSLVSCSGDDGPCSSNGQGMNPAVIKRKLEPWKQTLNPAVIKRKLEPQKQTLFKKVLEDKRRAIAHRYLRENLSSRRALLLAASMICPTPASHAKKR